METPGFVCKQTGECCREKRVHVTLLDIERMAAYLGISPREAVESYIRADPAASTALMLGKDSDGWCLLNTEDKRCRIHPAKPSACTLYICDPSLKSAQGYPWSLVFDNPEGLAFIVARSIAEEATEEYVRKHGAAWDEADYQEALAAIKRRVEESAKQTQRGARLADDSCAFIMFDCPACPLRASCCKDRPLTLDDVRAISDHLALTPRQCFERVVSTELKDDALGALSLNATEEGHCTFLDPATRRCTLDDVRPLHCRLIACPAIVREPDIAERYFLGAGTLADQFRYSVALAVTRHYVAEYGRSYNEDGFAKSLLLFEHVMADHGQFQDFCTSITPFRYENEPTVSEHKAGRCGQQQD